MSTSGAPRYERIYNAVGEIAARKLAQSYRRKGYEVVRDGQWVRVWAATLDMRCGEIARVHGAIAY